jgi:AcrR family transcriptional regulator
MSKAERRDAIVKAVLPVFARKGFHAATTKELAEAAQVSEALLYKHFPSKESLFGAIGGYHLQDRESHPEFEKVLSLPPSTRRLILSVQYLITHMANPRDDLFARLMAQSLLSDGKFARTVLERFRMVLLEFFSESIRAAAKSGDLRKGAKPAQLSMWFAHHLALALKFLVLPGGGVAEYGLPYEDVVDQAVRFVLRGLGLRNAAIRKHYDPKSWAGLKG